MTIIAAVTGNREGQLALREAVAEARRLSTDLVAVNLGTATLKLTNLDTDGVNVAVVDHGGKGTEGAADAVIDEIQARKATRLVIAVKRRTPIGKLVLGSLSQQLLLESPVPVLAVKLPEHELSSGAFDNLPAGMRQVTG